MYDKKNVIYISNLKQTLNHVLVLKKIQGVIQSSQKARLKLYTVMNAELRKNPKNEFENFFFKLMNKCFWENERKYEEI